MKHLEELKDDNTKYYYVMRNIQSMNRNNKSSIIVKDTDGNVQGSNEDKIKVIEKYFKDTLAPPDMEPEYLTAPPCRMTKEFTATEIKNIANKLNNDKAAGPDKLKAEFIKYAPNSTFEQIATIFNTTAETGDEPKALSHGLLHPLPKPGKKKGPPENLRPLILLSILRKILTIALLNRIWERLSEHIPKTQAAYQKGRGTTEQVLALKLLIDKAISSTDYDIYILLLDMSKAFDTVNRKTLMLELQEVLQPDEIHLLTLITNRPKLQITLNGDTGEEFPTFVGICQGDCLSAILFIFYLANALKAEPGEQVPKDLKAFLDVYYADDLTYATTSKEHRQQIKTEVPKKLIKHNLHANASKTEEGEAPDIRPPPPPPPPPLVDPGHKFPLWSPLDYLVPPPPPPPPEPSYKNIKLLGTKLDTKKDIDSRKSKVWDRIKKFSKYFKSKRLSIGHKVRVYRTYIEPLLLYNTETWTLTSKLTDAIDSFHRRLLRIAINIKYPRIIKNEKLYTLTQEIPLSQKIRKRRLTLLGHIL